MKLRDLLQSIPLGATPTHPNLDQEVKGICTNSHACQEGDLFIGMPGTRVDGGEFWSGALASGAIAAVISPQAAAKFPPSPADCVVQSPDLISACAQLAEAFYNYPARQLKMIGVTGTNGKTTTTHLIEFFLNQAQRPSALLGTLYTRWPGYEKTATHTTPFAADLQAQLAEALAAKNEFMVMEVSSHALAQGRVQGCPFQVAVFTNLTQDHLDFHRDMEEYFGAKALLFDPTYLQGRAIINLDDPYGERLLTSLETPTWSYSVNSSKADFYTSDLNYQAHGVTGTLHSPLGSFPFNSPLVGQFNLSNLLAALASVAHLGLDVEKALTHLPQFLGVPGRMERVQISPAQDVSVIVDYAHTPDSLDNLLQAARPFIAGKMICVFGCGGDRDRTKRPLMGAIVAKLADLTYVTSDNPRTEDPEKILEDISQGIPENSLALVVGDRATAIRTAILSAQAGDGVVIAGKGHEDYQILGTEKIHFDDREEARAALKERLGAITG
jgi:UDP-N-acetylmuramoyl-L-alanyl-D-glutamate--2,6-diaminopimelate ligase